MTASNPVLLEARDLGFSYPSGGPVIRGASLTLERGAAGAIIGANGCGKSTLIRLLARVLIPSGGDIEFDGAPLDSIDSRKLAKQIAYVPQNNPEDISFYSNGSCSDRPQPLRAALPFREPPGCGTSGAGA
jgi:ABC-type cobalamin/Fe3+-siderophores transport system ATPase subunit